MSDNYKASDFLDNLESPFITHELFQEAKTADIEQKIETFESPYLSESLFEGAFEEEFDDTNEAEEEEPNLLSPKQVKKAILANAYYREKLGWKNYVDRIVNLLDEYKTIPRDRTPNREVFAQLVARWQANNRVYPIDGIIGPKTWNMIWQKIQLESKDLLPSSGRIYIETPKKYRMSYSFTEEDRLWTARAIVGEAGNLSDRERIAVIWTLISRFALLYNLDKYRTFTKFIRRYSTPIQPYIHNWQKAKNLRRRKSQEWIELPELGTYEDGTPKGQLARHLTLQKTSLNDLPEYSRYIASGVLSGSISNPAKYATDFAAGRALGLKEGMTEDQMRTILNNWLKRNEKEHLLWVGKLRGINQIKGNTFFADKRMLLKNGKVLQVKMARTSQDSNLFSFDSELFDDSFSEADYQDDDYSLNELDDSTNYILNYQEGREFIPEKEENSIWNLVGDRFQTEEDAELSDTFALEEDNEPYFTEEQDIEFALSEDSELEEAAAQLESIQDIDIEPEFERDWIDIETESEEDWEEIGDLQDEEWADKIISAQFSPAADPTVAIPAFSRVTRNQIIEPFLSAQKIIAAIKWNNQEHPQRSGVELNHIEIDLQRYVNFEAIKSRMSAYFDVISTVLNLGISQEQLMKYAVLAEAVHQFQTKCFFDKKQHDGKAGKSTLNSLGIVKISNTKSIAYSSKAKAILKKVDLKNHTNDEFNASNWFDYIINPSFLGWTFSGGGVHLVLMRQLRKAEHRLLAKYGYITPVELWKKLHRGRVEDGDEGMRYVHRGLRNRGTNMHSFGLALDILYRKNPHVSDYKADRSTFSQILGKAAKAAGVELSSPSWGYFQSLQPEITQAIYLKIKNLNNAFIDYVKSHPKVDKTFRSSGSVFQIGKTKFTRQPKQGFLTLSEDLVIALRDRACLAWGAIDLGGASGDIMHFDLRTYGIGRQIALSVFQNKYGKKQGYSKLVSQGKGHPCVSEASVIE